jgi:hypothetical protein
MIICDACQKRIHRFEELCFTPDFRQAHAACFGNAIRAYLEWRSSPPQDAGNEGLGDDWLDHLFRD